MCISRYISVKDARRMGVTHRLYFRREYRKFNRPGLYLVEFEGGGVKIGISSNVQKRVAHYFDAWHLPVKSITMYHCAQPRRLELKAVKHFAKNIHVGLEYIQGVKLETIMKFIEQDPFYKPR